MRRVRGLDSIAIASALLLYAHELEARELAWNGPASCNQRDYVAEQVAGVLARCQLGAGGPALLADFEKQHPGSAYLTRLREKCVSGATETPTPRRIDSPPETQE